MESTFRNSNEGLQTGHRALMSMPRMRPALAAVAIVGCLLPVTAAAYVDYGFSVVDNSAGGSIMDNYITQELWADTDLRWLGNQFRLELDQGTIFQDEIDGGGFLTESNHEFLATTFDQPSLAYDTRIGVNGQAPSGMPGGAINLGGSAGRQFSESEINVAYGIGGGQYYSGAFNFGTFTLSKDAVGRGAVLFSMSGPDWVDYGHYAQTFEIDQGVIRFTGERVNLLDQNYNYTLENWQFVGHEIPARLPEPQPEAPHPESPAPDPPAMSIDSLPVEPPPVIQPDPVPQPEPLPEPIENPAEPPLPEPGEPIITPPETVFTPGDPIRWIPLPPVTTRPILIVDGVPTSVEHVEIIGRPVEIDFDFTAWFCGDLAVQWNAKQSDQAMLSSAGILRSLNGTELQLLTSAVAADSGNLLVPLTALSDAQRTSLLETGYWSLHGDYLLYSGTVGVPEPSSIALLLLASVTVAFWRGRVRQAARISFDSPIAR